MPSLACAAASARRADTRCVGWNKGTLVLRCERPALTLLCWPWYASVRCPSPAVPAFLTPFLTAHPLPPPAASTWAPPSTPSTPAETWRPRRQPSSTGLPACAAGRWAVAGRRPAAAWPAPAPGIERLAGRRDGCCGVSAALFAGGCVQGKAGCAPSAAELAAALQSRRFFLYCGHGGGEQYISGAASGRRLRARPPPRPCASLRAPGPSPRAGVAHLPSVAPRLPPFSRLQPPSCAAWSAAPRRCSWAAAAAGCARSSTTSPSAPCWPTCWRVGFQGHVQGRHVAMGGGACVGRRQGKQPSCMHIT